MNPRLLGMMTAVSIIVVGGVSYVYTTREPPDVTMAELRDAGAVSERTARWVFCAVELLDRRTRNRLRADGYGDFRVGTVHRICRVVWQYDNVDFAQRTDASVAFSLSNVFGDAGADTDDGGVGENDVSGLATYGQGFRLECNNADGGLNEMRFLPDGGFRYEQDAGVEDPFCSAINRPGRVTPPCVLPNCWTLADGGWDDSAVVDCGGIGPFGTADGGQLWRGCNVTPAVFAAGTACLPVECGVPSNGQSPFDVLR